MGAIKNLFIQPFPGCNLWLRNLRSSAIAGFIVFFIIYFLKPFGLNQVPANDILTHAFLYGIVTFVTTAANLLFLPRLLPYWFAEKSWTVGKELLMMIWQILTISLANALLTHILYGWTLSLSTFLIFLGYTSAVGIFPVSFLVLLKYTRLLKKHQEDADSLDSELRTEPLLDQRLIKLFGDYQNEILEVMANDILYVSAADNYIQVFYLRDGFIKSDFLRSTLKNAEQRLSEFPQFFRCHRTYLVNLQKIEHISGNAQGLKLHLQGSSDPVPVSRSLNQRLKLKMQVNKSGSVSP